MKKLIICSIAAFAILSSLAACKTNNNAVPENTGKSSASVVSVPENNGVVTDGNGIIGDNEDKTGSGNKSGLVSTIEDIADKEKSMVGSVAENIGNGVNSAIDSIGNAAGDVAEGAGNAVENIGDAAGNIADGAGNAARNVGDAVGDAAEGAGHAVENVGDAVGNVADGAADSLRKNSEEASE